MESEVESEACEQSTCSNALAQMDGHALAHTEGKGETRNAKRERSPQRNWARARRTRRQIRGCCRTGWPTLKRPATEASSAASRCPTTSSCRTRRSRNSGRSIRAAACSTVFALIRPKHCDAQSTVALKLRERTPHGRARAEAEDEDGHARDSSAGPR